MTAILALLPGIIGLIPSITTGVEKIIALVNSIRTASQQTGEWTPDLETQFLNALLATRTDPAWQPDLKDVVPVAPEPTPSTPVPPPVG